MVAFFRALADIGVTSLQGFHDPTAQHLLPFPWSQLFALAKRNAHKKPLPPALVGAQQGSDLLALRTLTIDAHLRDALSERARQLVILGAGLDGRAYRLRELADVRAFEVDHPATQAWKKRRAALLPRAARSVDFVPVDFERDSLDMALQQAGHDPSLPTAWIWEGVVMYLTDDAMRATLRTIGARSAPGSTVIIQYNTRRPSRIGVALVLRLWNEPQIGIRTPEEMAEELRAVGYEPIADSGLEDWAARFHAALPADPGQGLRVVAARRASGA
ncbi:MAG: class I SAM-dependent methyltransferase [Archangium sp.]